MMRILTLRAFCLTIITYLCTIPFATSAFAVFKSKFASPAEDPSKFILTTALISIECAVLFAVFVVVDDAFAIVCFFDDNEVPRNVLHKLLTADCCIVNDILTFALSVLKFLLLIAK